MEGVIFPGLCEAKASCLIPCGPSSAGYQHLYFLHILHLLTVLNS